MCMREPADRGPAQVQGIQLLNAPVAAFPVANSVSNREYDADGYR